MRRPTGGKGAAGDRKDTDDGTHEAEEVGCVNVTLRVSVPRGGRFNEDGD